MANEIEKVVRLNDEQLLDYIKCPNFFNLRYLSRIPYQKPKTFHTLVNEIVEAYMIQLFNGKVMSMDKAKKLWDKQIDNYPVIVNTEKKVLEGMGLITQIDRYCKKNQVLVADVNTTYSMAFPGNAIIEGSTGIVRLNNKKFELFIPEFSQTKPDQTLLDMSLKYTLKIYILNKLSPDANITNLRVYHVKSGNEYTSYRSKKDFDRLEKTIATVAKAIRNEIFYPREDYTCPQCLYKNYCGYT